LERRGPVPRDPVGLLVGGIAIALREPVFVAGLYAPPPAPPARADLVASRRRPSGTGDPHVGQVSAGGP